MQHWAAGLLLILKYNLNLSQIVRFEYLLGFQLIKYVFISYRKVSLFQFYYFQLSISYFRVNNQLTYVLMLMTVKKYIFTLVIVSNISFVSLF